MSELPDGIPAAEPAVPRRSASGVILGRDPAGGRRILLGLRSRKSRFLPGHLACPGGGLDDEDRPGSPGAYARCAAREVEEETGLAIPPERWIEAGERVTPPLFPLRFRTRFFVGEIPAGMAVPERSPSPGEIEALRFETPRVVIDEWRCGKTKVPPPTMAILRALDEAGELPLEEMAGRVGAANLEEERAPRIEFTPGVWMVPLRSATLPPASHTNAWLPGGKRFVIVDPGSGDEAELRRLLDVIERRRGLGHEPVAVVLTHHHRDHVGGAPALARLLGLPLRAHAQVLDSLPSTADGPERAILEDGDEIDLECCRLRACFTPGHAAGHIALHDAENGLLVAGDLVSGISTILINPDDGDMDLYMDSLVRMRDLGCRMLLPGHGPPLPGRALDKLIEHRREREARILEQLGATGAGLAEVARGAYADLPQAPAPLTELQATSHLLALERRGRVRRDDAAGRRWSPT